MVNLYGCRIFVAWLLVAYPVVGNTVVQRAQRLGSYNVDRTKISTSGISSGASMATQMHVAFSASFMGAGLVAGSPYYCAKGVLVTALNACMSIPSSINVNDLITETNKYASSGDIDATTNMRNDRIFIFGGIQDSTVVQGVGMKAQQFYLNYVNEGNIKTVYDMAAGHTFPTVNYGNTCTLTRSPYIGKCDYKGAYVILQHIYNDLVEPPDTVALNGQLYEFDQTEFITGTVSASSMDTIGFVYVPSGCVSGADVCRLHVAYHGCLQGRGKINDEFVRNAGYNEVGEVNNIIILYPQATVSYVPNNPNGCWDWWAYTNNKYATKTGIQMAASWKMVQRIAF